MKSSGCFILANFNVCDWPIAAIPRLIIPSARTSPLHVRAVVDHLGRQTGRKRPKADIQSVPIAAPWASHDQAIAQKEVTTLGDRFAEMAVG